MALICSFRGKPIPPLPEPAVFKPKFRLPTLSTYRGEFNASYWAKWKKRTLADVLPHKSWVSSSALRDMAYRVGYQDIDRLGRVCHRLDNGAEIGVRGGAGSVWSTTMLTLPMNIGTGYVIHCRTG